MSDEKHTKNFESPMMVQGCDPNKVACKDCAFRNRMTFDNKGQIIPIGVIKSWCDVYTMKNSNGKPIGVLMRNEPCKYYRKDEE